MNITFKKLLVPLFSVGGIGFIQRIVNIVVAGNLIFYLKPEGYGIYAFALSIVYILALPVQFAFPQLIVKETPVFLKKEQWDLFAGLLKWCNSWVILISLCIVFVTTLVLFLGDYLGFKIQLSVFLISLLSIPLLGMNGIRSGFLRGLGYPTLAYLPEGILAPILNWLLISIFYIKQNALTLQQAMFCYILSLFSSFLLGQILISKLLPKELSGVPFTYRGKTWGGSIIPFSLTAGGYIVNNQADIIMLGSFGMLTDLGFYQALVKLTSLITSPLNVISYVIASQISNLHSSNNTKELQTSITFAARLVFSLALPVALSFIIFNNFFLVRLLNIPVNNHTFSTLFLLVSGNLVNVFFGPANTILNMTGNEKDTLNSLFCSSVLNLILNIIIIPYFGMSGAAFSTLLSFCVYNFLQWRAVNKKLNIESSPL